MSRKQKRRKNRESENERYEIEVKNWEVYYHFGINKVSRDLISGDYCEYSNLILVGNILSPSLKNAAQAKIKIRESPGLDNHWREDEMENPPPAIGLLEIPRGEDVLKFICFVPSRSFRFITMAVSAEKIRYVSLFGTKLKWRKGEIFDISLSNNRDEE